LSLTVYVWFGTTLSEVADCVIVHQKRLKSKGSLLWIAKTHTHTHTHIHTHRHTYTHTHTFTHTHTQTHTHTHTHAYTHTYTQSWSPLRLLMAYGY